MIRFAVLALAIGCSNTSPTATAAPLPVAKPVAKPAPVAPTEKPSLVTAEAIHFLPDTTTSIAVASSLDAVATLSDAPLFVELAKLSPGGLSRTRPIGIAFVGPVDYEGDGWIAFGYVDDAKAFDASVPSSRRARRSELAFVASSAATLRQVRPEVGAKHRRPDLTSNSEFQTGVAKLHLGALASWWVRWEGAAGIAVDNTTLFVNTPERLPTGLGMHDHLADASTAAMELVLLGTDVPEAMRTKQERISKQLAELDDELDKVRDATVADLTKQLGAMTQTRSGSPVDVTFIAPVATLKAWLAPFVERWRAPALQAKRDTMAGELAAIERQIDHLPRKLDGDMGRRTPGADLTPQISADRAIGSGRGTGGNSDARVGTGTRTPTTP